MKWTGPVTALLFCVALAITIFIQSWSDHVPSVTILFVVLCLMIWFNVMFFQQVGAVATILWLFIVLTTAIIALATSNHVVDLEVTVFTGAFVIPGLINLVRLSVHNKKPKLAIAEVVHNTSVLDNDAAVEITNYPEIIQPTHHVVPSISSNATPKPVQASVSVVAGKQLGSVAKSVKPRSISKVTPAKLEVEDMLHRIKSFNAFSVANEPQEV